MENSSFLFLPVTERGGTEENRYSLESYLVYGANNLPVIISQHVAV